MEQEQIEQAARLLRSAQRVVALTGAGISTASGVPDFRGRGGVWQNHEPEKIAALGSFRRDPQVFFAWFRPLLELMLKAPPNAAHHALAELERSGKLTAVVTQNIDGLHQRAGSREVYELHGHLRSATCIECDQQVPSEPLFDKVRKGSLLRCSCGSHYKPDVVLFDEMLPRGLFWLAQRAIEHADLILVAGTSLEVAPAGDLPVAGMRRGAKLMIVNFGPTYLDDAAHLVIRGDVATVLPTILQAM